MTRAGILTFTFLIIFYSTPGKCNESMELISIIENKIELKLEEYARSFTSWLERFNDNHLGKSGIGRFLQYDEMKPKIENTVNKQERGMKKLGMTLIPLVYHVGATSTWMVLTTLLAAKAVAIGLVLLVFKIAVSSAKVASFFTALKGQKHEEGYSWAPHHGHYRSHSLDHPSLVPNDNSYNPEWAPSSHYSTISKDSGPSTYVDKKEYK